MTFLFTVVYSVIIVICGVTTLHTGITCRKKEKPGLVPTVLLICCGIAVSLAPLFKSLVSPPLLHPETASETLAAVGAAVTMIWLYTAMYLIAVHKKKENMYKLVFVYAVIVGAAEILMSFLILTETGIFLIASLPK